MDEGERLALLRAVDSAPGGAVTQRQVAVALTVSKIEARRRLRAATQQGLVRQRIDDSPAAPRRRLYSLTADLGRAELERLAGDGA